MKKCRRKIKKALERHDGIYVDTIYYEGGFVFQPDNAEVTVYLGLTTKEALQRAEQGPPF